MDSSLLPEGSGPFRVIVYDKDYRLVGFVVDPLFENWVPSWEDQGYGNFRLTGDNPHTEAVQADGARVTVEYRGKVVISGPITSWDGDILSNGNITYQVLDDSLSNLEDTLLFVAPDNPLMPTSISGLGQAWKRPQGDLRPGEVVYQDGYYQWPTSVRTPEAAIKWVIRDQLVERLGRPITILADRGRGGVLDRDVLPRIRFDPVNEALTALLATYQLGVRIWQNPGDPGLYCDVFERGIWPTPLTVESGIVEGGTYQKRRPTVTRPIVGGNGDTAARAFYGVEGAGYQTDRERQFGMIAELFRDATNGEMIWPEGTPDEKKVPKYGPFVMTSENWASYLKTLQKSEATALLDSAATTSLNVKLSETDTFHFGGSDGLQLGDIVTTVIRGVTFVDTVTSAQLVYNRDDGLVVTPIIGTYEDDPDAQLGKVVSELSKSNRRQATRK